MTRKEAAELWRLRRQIIEHNRRAAEIEAKAESEEDIDYFSDNESFGYDAPQEALDRVAEGLVSVGRVWR